MGHWVGGFVLGGALCAGVVLGFVLRAFAGRIAEVAGAVLTPRRHAARLRLRRCGDGLEVSDDDRVVGSALVDEAVAVFDLASAALFVRVGDGAFAPDRLFGWPDETASLRPGHPFLMHAAGARASFRLATAPELPHAPAGAAAPVIAIPIRFRGTLAAVAVYGRPARGRLDRERVRALERLAGAASVALDRADAATLRAINAELRAALAAAMAAGS